MPHQNWYILRKYIPKKPLELEYSFHLKKLDTLLLPLHDMDLYYPPQTRILLLSPSQFLSQILLQILFEILSLFLPQIQILFETLSQFLSLILTLIQFYFQHLVCLFLSAQDLFSLVQWKLSLSLFQILSVFETLSQFLFLFQNLTLFLSQTQILFETLSLILIQFLLHPQIFLVCCSLLLRKMALYCLHLK